MLALLALPLIFQSFLLFPILESFSLLGISFDMVTMRVLFSVEIRCRCAGDIGGVTGEDGGGILTTNQKMQ